MSSINTDTQLEQLNGWFNALGYRVGDKVCFQYVLPEKFKKSVTPMFKNNQLTMTFPLKSIPPHREPFTIFFIVNGQGFLTGDIAFTRAIFCEFDDIPKEEQLTIWQKFNLPEPSIQLDTGNKSIHTYWIFDKPFTDLQAWRKLTEDLIALTGADKANKNANRLLRPPTFQYCYKKEVDDSLIGKFNGERAKVVSHSGKKYSYVELRNAIPDSTIRSVTVSRSENIVILMSDSDLEQKMLEVALDYISSDDYNTWVEVGMALKSANYPFSLWDNWSQKSTKYKGNLERKWDSFKNSGITIATVFKLAQDNGFDQKQWLRDNGNKTYKSSYQDHPQKTRENLDKTFEKSSDEVNELDVNQLLDQLVEQLAKPDVTEAKRKLETAKFSSLYRVAPSIIEKAIEERLKEDSKQDELQTLAPKLDNLLAVPKKQLDIESIFGEEFAGLVRNIASEVPTNPDAMITILLPEIASIVGTRSRVVVNEHTDYFQPFALRTMIVADSGRKKTPTAKVVLKPLKEKNRALAEHYKEQYLYYKEELTEWERLKPSERGEKPVEPIQRQLLIQDSTIDGMVKAHQDNPIGFLCFVDELAGLFKRHNKHSKSGTGDDIERDLELYNGDTYIKTRANKENNIYLPRTAISITGTIQPIAIEQLFDSNFDLQGITCRWLMWCGEMPLGYLQPRKEQNQLFFDYLNNVLNAIDNLYFSDIRLDDNAYEMFMAWQHDVMNALEKVDLPQVALKYAKIEGEVARMAGVLHYWHLICNPDWIDNPLFINSQTVLQAIMLGNHYLEHFAYLCQKCQKNLIDSNLIKILELLERKGELRGTDCRNYLFKDIPTKEIDIMLLDLVAMGKCELIPTKRGVKVKKLS